MGKLKKQWAEYTELASRTMGRELGRDAQIRMCILGLMGELGEILKEYRKYDYENMIMEFGDFFWYLSQCSLAADIDLVGETDYSSIRFQSFVSPEVTLSAMVCESAGLIDVLKKHLYHLDDFDENRVAKSLSILFADAIRFTGNVLVCDPYNIWMGNIAKLKHRWPGKFGEKSEGTN